MTKVLAMPEQISKSLWTTNLEQCFDVYHFNDHINEQKFEATEIINRSPQLLKDIQKARESLKSGKIYSDKDLFPK